MKLGLFLAVYGQLSIEQALDQAKAAGVEAVEMVPVIRILDGWLDNPSAQCALEGCGCIARSDDKFVLGAWTAR